MSAAPAIAAGYGMAAPEIRRAKVSLVYINEFVLKSRTQALVDSVEALVGLAEHFSARSDQDGQLRIFDVLSGVNSELDDVLSSLDDQKARKAMW